MRILFTVTNQLNYDQRMIRICNSLAKAGYEVELIGVRFTGEKNLKPQHFHQKKLRVFFKKGFLFYAEYNFRLFLYLLFKKADALCSVDLDTILPVYAVSKLRSVKRIQDAHEYFTQMKEVVTRKKVYRFWYWVERTFLPAYPAGYTVSSSISTELKRKYGIDYEVIRNVPLLDTSHKRWEDVSEISRIIIYQGSVNHGRGFEYLIPAMKGIDAVLWIYGEGNFMQEARRLCEVHQLDNKVKFKGNVEPEELKRLTPAARLGVNLVEPVGLSQIYSLANKFFDYIHAGIPQVTMNFPEYKAVNDEYEIAVLLDDLDISCVSKAIQTLLENDALHSRLKLNCLRAREELNWQKEEQKLIGFYEKMLK